MNLEQIEKDLAKYQRLVINLDKEIAVNESKLQSIKDELKKEFGVNSMEEADELLQEISEEMKVVDEEISRRVSELNSKYEDLL